MRRIPFLLALMTLAGTAQARTVDELPATSLSPTSGTATIASSRLPDGKVVKYSIAWTSDSAGRVTATVPDMYGYILRVTTNPGDSTAAPSDNYDIVLNDEDTTDTLQGLGANRDESTVETITPHVGNVATGALIPMPVAGDLYLLITNAGDANSGVIRVYMKEE
jgi:hypothetical protein